MNIYRSLLVPALVLSSLCGLGACGPVNLKRASIQKSVADKDSSARNSNEIKSGQAEVAAEPVPVGGSYLTCQVRNMLADADRVTIDCAANTPDADSKREAAIDFKFAQGDGSGSKVALQPLSRKAVFEPTKSHWLWAFEFLRTSLTSPRMFIEVSDQLVMGREPLRLDISLAEAKRLFLSNQLVHIGDDQTFTQEFVPATNAYDCPEIPASTPREITLQRGFEVTSAQADIEIRLDGVCGISELSNGKNKVEIVDARSGIIVQSIGLVRFEVQQIFKVSGLALGSYQLRVVSNNIPRDDDTPSLDDFIIEKVSLLPLQGTLGAGLTVPQPL